MNSGESDRTPGFPSTHWSQVYLACHREQAAGARALAELILLYRPALLLHLRHRFSVSPEVAGDWLSGFVEKRVLEKDLLSEADANDGRFRGFLIKSLDRFVMDQIRRENRQCRKPEGGLVSFDELLEHQMPVAGGNHPDPGDRAWAILVVDQAKDRTEAFYRTKEKPTTWEVFLNGFYLPLRSGTARPSDGELASRYGFDSPARVSNTITTVKRKFGSCLREVVAQYVPSTADIEAEIRELMAILGDESGD